MPKPPAMASVHEAFMAALSLQRITLLPETQISHALHGGFLREKDSRKCADAGPVVIQTLLSKIG